jgi:hypothetical protein
MTPQTISKEADLSTLRSTVLESARSSVREFERLAQIDPLEALVALKFTEVGHHPLQPRRLNLIEQVNQTFTYLASFAAVEYVLTHHPNSLPIVLNLGTAPGWDLESSNASVAAEVFAAVRPENNRKLQNDIAKIATADARSRYVFYFCPGSHCAPYQSPGQPGVTVVPLTREQVLTAWRRGA